MIIKERKVYDCKMTQHDLEVMSDMIQMLNIAINNPEILNKDCTLENLYDAIDTIKYIGGEQYALHEKKITTFKSSSSTEMDSIAV